jgi:hypothetical protein
LRILWITFMKVVNRKDVNSDNHVTMEKFKGSSQ